MTKLKHIVLTILILMNLTVVYSAEKTPTEDALDQELKWLQSETYVITASRVMEEISKAPASITVVTDRQIEQMGARNLLDILRAVPGFAGFKVHTGNQYIITRGSGERLFLLVDSHPVYEPWSGGAKAFETLNIQNIKRVEFIRGPGSALYGANAFFHAINVITKDAEDIDGVELSAKGGMFCTREYNLLAGKVFGDLEAVLNLNYFKSHGYRGIIEEDFQTYIDKQWEPYFDVLGIGPASLAPGPMAGNDEKVDTSLKLDLNSFYFEAMHTSRRHDLPVGPQAALNNKSTYSFHNYYYVLGFEEKISRWMTCSGNIYSTLHERELDVQYFPPGFTAQTPTGHAVFPDGMLGQLSFDLRRSGAEFQPTFQTHDNNKLLTGITYEKQSFFNLNHMANWLPADGPADFIPLPSIQKIHYKTGTLNRYFVAAFIEDIWDISRDIRLTTGVRYDRYSDFGDHISPRAGLTWEYLPGYDVKLLYGHAFRAPSFEEAYDPNYGSVELDPETIDTYEICLGASPFSSFNTRFTYFYNELNDTILQGETAGSIQIYNSDKAIYIHGFEVEAKYNFGRGNYAGAYYTLYDPNDPPGVWGYSTYTFVNLRFSKYLNLYTDFTYAGNLCRTKPDDPRDDPHDIQVINLSLTSNIFIGHHDRLELKASIYNFFDEQYAYPNPDFLRLPHDFPAPGRSYLIEAKLSF